MGHSGDDAVHKRSHKMKTHWENQQKSLVLVYFKVFCRIRHKKICPILVQCPLNKFTIIYIIICKSLFVCLGVCLSGPLLRNDKAHKAQTRWVEFGPT